MFSYGKKEKDNKKNWLKRERNRGGVANLLPCNKPYIWWLTHASSKTSNSNLSCKELSQSRGSVPHDEIGVRVWHALQCLLQYDGLVVHHRSDGDLGRVAAGLALASLGHHLYLGVADRRQHQLADLQRRQESTPVWARQSTPVYVYLKC